MKILIYTHNTSGLGHANRACAIAAAIMEYIPGSDVLCVGGVDLGKTGWLPSTVEYVKLPSYGRRWWAGKEITRAERLSLSKEELAVIRRAILSAILETYVPDVCIIDFFPRGKLGELFPALGSWRAASSKHRLCFGLRPFIDSPERAFQETLSNEDIAILRTIYDDILIYGDRSIVDVTVLYPELREIQDKCVYSGYVIRKSTQTGISGEQIRREIGCLPHQKLIVVSLGSGWKAESLLDLAVRAVQLVQKNDDVVCALFWGPKLDSTTAREILHMVENMPVFRPPRFVVNVADYLSSADFVIARGGYNTLAEILLTRTHAVVVPSYAMGDEQSMHAHRLAELGFLQVKEERELTSESLASLIESSLTAGRMSLPPPPALDGAAFVAAWLAKFQ